MDEITGENTIENINLITILDVLKSDIYSNFAKTYKYNQNIEQDKVVSKITKNINIIKKLYVNEILYHNETIINIYNILQKIIFMNNHKLLDYKKIRKELGYIIFDIYRFSGYHLLMSNIPKTTLTIPIDKIDDINDIDNTELINSEIMYDTIQHYIGLNTVDTIFQVTESIYIVKMNNLNDIVRMCNLLNKMQINNNEIKVEALLHLENPAHKPIENNLVCVGDFLNPVIENTVDNINLIESESNISNNLIASDISNISNMTNISNVSIVSNISNISNIDIDKEEDDENIIHISGELDEMKPSLFADLAYGIYNKISKISSIFSFFRRS